MTATDSGADADASVPIDVDVDVVVVGAGVAGLATARSLIAGRLSAVVLEARDRVGGRLLSHETSDGHRRDLGATWFWPNEPRVIELIQELDIEVFSQHLDGDAMYHDPDGSQRISGNPLDVPSGRFRYGADSLTNALAAELPPEVVRLENVVAEVDVHDDGAVVSGPGFALRAQHVVLALPPAIAVQQIGITPGLPDPMRGLAATTPVWMGATTKAVITYRRPFWREHGLAGAAISHFGPLREIHDMSGYEPNAAALFGFASGQAGGETVTRDAVVAQLTELFGHEAATPVDVLIHDWRTEPYTSPPNADQMTAYQTYGHPLYQTSFLGGRLHWASTETSQQNPGHIEGALVAAARTATAILETPVPTQSNPQGAT